MVLSRPLVTHCIYQSPQGRIRQPDRGPRSHVQSHDGWGLPRYHSKLNASTTLFGGSGIRADWASSGHSDVPTSTREYSHHHDVDTPVKVEADPQNLLSRLQVQKDQLSDLLDSHEYGEDRDHSFHRVSVLTANKQTVPWMTPMANCKVYYPPHPQGRKMKQLFLL